jgi:hypothetical protein
MESSEEIPLFTKVTCTPEAASPEEVAQAFDELLALVPNACVHILTATKGRPDLQSALDPSAVAGLFKSQGGLHLVYILEAVKGNERLQSALDPKTVATLCKADLAFAVRVLEATEDNAHLQSQISITDLNQVAVRADWSSGDLKERLVVSINKNPRLCADLVELRSKRSGTGTKPEGQYLVP